MNLKKNSQPLYCSHKNKHVIKENIFPIKKVMQNIIPSLQNALTRIPLRMKS